MSEKENEYMISWKNRAEELRGKNVKIIESHAHYDLDTFNGVRTELLPLMHKSGIEAAVIPAIRFCSNERICLLSNECKWLFPALGEHPKYAWNDQWNLNKFGMLKKLLKDNNNRVIAIGEAGLDYSYKGFCEAHKVLQMRLFEDLVNLANDNRLPMILHIRSGVEMDADKDALSLLSKNTICHGSVLHCYGGDKVDDYIASGVTAFGIGGRIIKEEKLRSVVYELPQSKIILETDSPFIRVNEDKCPNTSLTLWDIAKEIGMIKGICPESVIKMSNQNILNLFPKMRR